MGKLANLSREKEETEELNNNQISQLAKKHNSLKGMFFSMLCHQFRSSLNIISFSNSLLKRHFLNTEKKQEQEYLLNNIQAGVEEISKLLDELVFYGKLENQEIEFSPDLIDINLYCEQIVEQTRSSDLNQRRIINFKKNSNNEVVCLDKKLLKPMITNLLTNAIKHSSENSSIDLEISCQKQKTIFQIKDRGIGIEQGDLPKLFEPFFRGSNVGSIKGNGMGLAIVKNLVEIQRGSIDISSVVGIGTTVTVTLPSFSYVSKSIN